MEGLSGHPVASAVSGSLWAVHGRLATISDYDLDELGTFLESEFDIEATDSNIGVLQHLVHAAKSAKKRAISDVVGASVIDLHRGVKVHSLASASVDAVISSAAPARVGKAVPGRWPTRLSKKLAAAGDALITREQIEDKERDRWIAELSGIIVTARFPAASELEDKNQSGLSLARRFAKGRRPATLRIHVKNAQKIIAYSRHAFVVPWPATVYQFLAYLDSRISEPCAKSVPVSMFKSLLFCEVAGEVPKQERLSEHPAIKNFLEEVGSTLKSHAAGRKKADQWPVLLCIALELTVTDPGEHPFVRALAWFKLVKLWTGMRHSDIEGAPYDRFRLDLSRGLSLVLERTKTSGAGKKNEVLFAFVALFAYVADPKWLVTGWGIWKDLTIKSNTNARDFMLCRPTPDLESFLPVMAKYADATSLSQALLADLKRPKWSPKGWALSQKSLLISPLQCGWSEHSERVTIRTWASAAGVSTEAVQKMERWQAKTDEEYNRTLRRVVEESQGKIAAFLQGGFWGPDRADEAALFERMAFKASKLGADSSKVAECIDRFQYFCDRPVISEAGQQSDREPSLESCTGDLERSFDRDAFSNGEFSPVPANVASEDDGFGQGSSFVHVESDAAGAFHDDLEQGSFVELVRQGEVTESPLTEVEVECEKVQAPVVDVDTHLGTFFVSLVGRSQKKTLHKGGECFRVPGIHYRSFLNLGSEPPEPESYHKLCTDCFPKGLNEAMSGTDVSSTGITSSDSDEDIEA